MHKVTAATAVNKPGRMGYGGVGQPAAKAPAFPWPRPADPCCAAIALNPGVEPA
jgi:hypothetical protein